MQTIYELKEHDVTETPLLIFECTLSDRTERWSTHRISVNGAEYQARVVQHNVFEIQAASAQGVDGIPRISIVLANADSRFSEIERHIGFKGARLTVGFLFYDLRNDRASTETAILFQGICNPPDEIRETTLRLTATNRMNLQRLLLPRVRIQRRCPWEFPVGSEQRTEAVDGGAKGKYSRFYPCGYSAGEAGGSGRLNDELPYTSCGYTRSDCVARGMFPHFGGIEFVPPAISVRTYGDKSWHQSAVAVNAARYNDFVPLIYGTAWYTPPVVFARNDGNLTRMEVLLGMGEMQGVLKVLVNDVEIPAGLAGTNMTGTGWYNIPTLGTRAGQCNGDFTDGSGQPAGDPYGSMAYLSVVVPNRLNDATSLPRVKVLAQGLKLPVYGEDGASAGEQFSNNPAWIVLDLLRRSGWDAAEIDLPSFASAAALCEEGIATIDLHGNSITLPRFQCNLAIQSRRSAGDLVRGVRNTARLLLTYGMNGLLQLRVENTAALEQPTKPECSNSSGELQNGGWASYEFGDGANGFSGILRKSNGEPSVRVFSRSIADTPNRFSVEFQDALNDYQQDSFSLVDPEDVARSGQEVSTTLSALGVANYDQAARLLKFNLDRSVRGNSYVEFDTSVKSLGLRAGDLITVTYLKEGLDRQLFRILKIAPGLNHRVTTITAQIHDDAWYEDTNGQLTSAPGGRRQTDAGLGVPKPLMGTVLDENGDVQFGVEETAATNSDGTAETRLTVSFNSPAIAGGVGPAIPLIDLAAHVTLDGTIAGDQTLYYAVSAINGHGDESGLSFIVRASIAADGSAVTLNGLSFSSDTTAFRVYRGTNPAAMFRIASDQAPAVRFTDTGFMKELVPPCDANFDHASFYWRMELQPEVQVTQHSPNSMGNDSLQMTENRYRSMTGRITRGRGAGQERSIVSNTGTNLTVSPAWDMEPDASSFFVVAENGWHFGALGTTSPVQFAVPNRAGETVEISGRAANVNDVECSPELSVVTRWQIGGSGSVPVDSAVPATPYFGAELRAEHGAVVLSGISFDDFTNTHTISSATMTLFYWDELNGVPPIPLANGVGPEDDVLDLEVPASGEIGTYMQAGMEVMRIEEVQNGGTRYRVTRAMDGTTAAALDVDTPVCLLSSKTVIASFPPGFFGSPYSGSWSYAVPLPDARVVSAELFVTNSKGNSGIYGVYLTRNGNNGVRTLSGGQYSIQVEGYLAIDESVAPPLVVEESHSVGDVYAVLGTSADAAVQVRVKVDGNTYCDLTFDPGMIVSDSADGAKLPPLTAKSQITVAVLSVGKTAPGADLTVVIRL
jgi:hypothetical protein